LAGWLGAVLAIAGCDSPGNTPGTFEEADVRAYVEELRDAWQRGDGEKNCALRSRNAVVVVTQQPLRAGAEPRKAMFTGEQVCDLARQGSAWPRREVELLDMKAEMADDGTGATVVAHFRESIPLDGKVTESRVLLVLGMESGRLVSLREDMSIRVVQSRQIPSPAPSTD
jgi:ketosteroid isomerase-like protein